MSVSIHVKSIWAKFTDYDMLEVIGTVLEAVMEVENGFILCVGVKFSK